MSGQTGKMTREAIRARGPRFALLRIVTNERRHMVLCREDQRPLSRTEHDVNWMRADWYYVVVAKSYSKSYLLKVAEGNR